ncbi:hypothetical protein [Spirosoma validum]|uniref:Uncharacterized protein n=1 Tax=Spirosoma validum TaxID=2771355 RepID=A0A927B1T7_9BACT|nr:hypothetical protein [Spirosoma validum]MBD2753796.1 hypothetical protein [Spirosoma validum]
MELQSLRRLDSARNVAIGQYKVQRANLFDELEKSAKKGWWFWLLHRRRELTRLKDVLPQY